MVSRSIRLLEIGGDAWIELKEKKQFQFLGFHHDPGKLLYVADYTTLKSNPTSQSKPDFLRDDNNLSKCSAFPVKEIMAGGVSYKLHRAQCNGVKVMKVCFHVMRSLTNFTSLHRTRYAVAQTALLQWRKRCEKTLV